MNEYRELSLPHPHYRLMGEPQPQPYDMDIPFSNYGTNIQIPVKVPTWILTLEADFENAKALSASETTFRVYLPSLEGEFIFEGCRVMYYEPAGLSWDEPPGTIAVRVFATLRREVSLAESRHRKLNLLLD